MRYLRALAGLLLVTASTASAQTLTRGPLIQNPDALTTTMTIEWWTDVAGNSTVEYGTTPVLGSSVTVPQAPSCAIGAAGTCHAVPLTGLLPGTRYYYRLLTNGNQVLATTYFQTFKLPTDTSELYFTVIGDWGQGSSAQGRVADNQNADDPPLIVTVGDNAYQNGTQSDWDNNAFIAQYENQILRRAVFMPALGNHDVNNVGAANWATSIEIRMHLLPRNATAGDEERYFSFDSGDAHFIVLDSNSPAITSTQTDWLRADLAATSRKWKFVFLHHTPYSCANGFASLGSDHNVRNTWGPIFEEFRVDIVFDGHDHIYERSKLVDDFLLNGSPGSDGRSTLYVMSGGGGATLDSAALVDGGGPYGQGPLHAKEYCPWLSNQCANGVNGQYCSFARFQHAEARIINNTTLTIKAIDENDAVFDQFSIMKTGFCDDGVVNAGEECDQGAALNGANGSCCTASCLYVAGGTPCRASAGVCDVAESCTGSGGQCPANGFVSSTTVCRPAVDLCDAAETCTGSSAACPANGVEPTTTVCRIEQGFCDLAEHCDGSSTACPPDIKSSGECRAVLGPCDVAESCDGVSNNCPANGVAPSGTSCRPSAGVCDVAEACDGGSASCPADGFAAGTLCRPSAGICDVAETCSGSAASCPADGFASTTTMCRAASGVCDVAENCNGSSASCPADGFAPTTTTCRPASGVCDQAESCTGAAPSCPANGFKSSSTVCRPSASPCDATESCTGSSAGCPADGFASSTTVCRPVADVCDQAESCSGTSGSCPADVFAPTSVVCRAAASVCDMAESCTGAGTACPPNGFAPSGIECRPSAGVCDVSESCTGAAPLCPTDGLVASGTPCRPATDVCDQEEACNGMTAGCPVDGYKSSTTTCRPSADVCDVAESCSGAGSACPADAFRSSTFECRPSTGGCDAPESCMGSSAVCPADTGQPDGDGDGVCDVDDDCPTEPDPAQADNDADGLGDVCDPCNNYLPVHVVGGKIKLRKLAPPPGDDQFKFSGSVTVPMTPSIDPRANGVRVVVTDAADATILDAIIPPGTYDPLAGVGWKVNGSATTFVYRNSGATAPFIAGIRKVVVKLSTKDPGLIKFKVSAKNATYVLPTMLPLVGTFVFDPPHATTNQCGEALFPGPLSPLCAWIPPAGSIKCK